MPDNDGSTSTDALQVILAAAAFDYAAKASATWAEVSDQETATAMFAGLAELARIELSDPTWSTQPETLEAVSRISQAYAAAAKAVRRTDAAPELGHGEIKQHGLTYAADWLQSQADTFALIAAQLGDHLPAREYQGRVTFKPASDTGRCAVEFATLVAVLDDQIDVTVHQGEPEANAYYRQHHRDIDSLHRIDKHTISLADGEDSEDWLRGSPQVEFVTLAVVRDGQIDLTVHGNEHAARIDLSERFPGTELSQMQYRIDSHRVAVCE